MKQLKILDPSGLNQDMFEYDSDLNEYKLKLSRNHNNLYYADAEGLYVDKPPLNYSEVYNTLHRGYNTIWEGIGKHNQVINIAFDDYISADGGFMILLSFTTDEKDLSDPEAKIINVTADVSRAETFHEVNITDNKDLNLDDIYARFLVTPTGIKLVETFDRVYLRRVAVI